MVAKRTIVTPELEAAAHRMAAASARYEGFYMKARNGVLSYLGVERDGVESMYSLIGGEWCEIGGVDNGER